MLPDGKWAIVQHLKKFNRRIQESASIQCFCVNTPIQLALAEYMKNDEHYTYLNQFFRGKRDFLRKGLAGTSFELLDCEGTYFQALKYDKISDKMILILLQNLPSIIRWPAFPSLLSIKQAE